MEVVTIHDWGKLHSKVLSLFLNRMNDVAIPYFILRNYEGLPEINTSKDVDIIIQPGKYHTAKKILLDTFKQCGLSNYYVMDFERAHCIFGINLNLNFSIHIDLIEGYANKGFEILSFDYLYQNTIPYKNFRVLSNALNSIMLILYKVIGCKELKEKYRTAIQSAFQKNEKEMQQILIEVLGNHTGNDIFNNISNNNYDRIVKHSKQISRAAKLRVIKQFPFKTFIGIVFFLQEKAMRMIICCHKFQKSIAVEAPDGTGKTTFINKLIQEIAHTFVSDISKSHIYHHRPNILPNLGAVGEKTGVMKQDKDFTIPHRAKPVGFLSSFIRMTYYWLDYVIGMPFILRKDAQFDNITIFDRYIYDFLVDPYRTRIKLPYWIRKVFTKLVKQPKIVFVLDADANTIYSRKQELCKEEINRQLMEFRKLKHLGERVYILDASQTPQQIANDAIRIVIDKFTHKL